MVQDPSSLSTKNTTLAKLLYCINFHHKMSVYYDVNHKNRSMTVCNFNDDQRLGRDSRQPYLFPVKTASVMVRQQE